LSKFWKTRFKKNKIAKKKHGFQRLLILPNFIFENN
jgi:hypothetical protein